MFGRYVCDEVEGGGVGGLGFRASRSTAARVHLDAERFNRPIALLVYAPLTFVARLSLPHSKYARADQIASNVRRSIRSSPGCPVVVEFANASIKPPASGSAADRLQDIREVTVPTHLLYYIF